MKRQPRPHRRRFAQAQVPAAAPTAATRARTPFRPRPAPPRRRPSSRPGHQDLTRCGQAASPRRRAGTAFKPQLAPAGARYPGASRGPRGRLTRDCRPHHPANRRKSTPPIQPIGKRNPFAAPPNSPPSSNPAHLPSRGSQAAARANRRCREAGFPPHARTRSRPGLRLVLESSWDSSKTLDWPTAELDRGEIYTSEDTLGESSSTLQ